MLKVLCRQNPDGSLVPDPFSDDQSIIVKSSEGTIVLLGCTHAGLINTLSYVAELTGNDRIHAFIGGTHLVAASEERIDYTLKEIERFGVQVIAPCHCTGFHATSIFYQTFKDRFTYCSAGKIFSFGSEV